MASVWRLLICLVLALGLSAPALGQGMLSDAEDQWLMNKGIMRVGIEPDQAPLSFVDQEGRPQGILVDYWKELAMKVGFRLVFKPAKLSSLVTMMQKGEIDSLGGMEPGEDARELFDFTGLFAQVESHAFASPQQAEGVAGWAEIKKLLVGAVEGSWEQLLAIKAGVKPQAFPGPQEALSALAAGKVEAVVMQDWVARFFASGMGISDKVVPAGRPIGVQGLALPVKRGNPVLLTILNKGVMLVYPDKVKAMVDKWTTAPLQ